MHKNYSIITSVASLKIVIASLTRTNYRSKGLFKNINIHTNRIDYIITIKRIWLIFESNFVLKKFLRSRNKFHALSKKRKNYEKEFQSCCTQLCIISTERYLQIFNNMCNWYQAPFVCLNSKIFIYQIDLQRFTATILFYNGKIVRKLNIRNHRFKIKRNNFVLWEI